MCLPTLEGGRARLKKSDHGAQALTQHREEEKEEEVVGVWGADGRDAVCAVVAVVEQSR